MQPFKPTHRIIVTKHGGLITAKESFTVMLVDGAAYTEAEWAAKNEEDRMMLRLRRPGAPEGPVHVTGSAVPPAWERTDAGEWRYKGDVAVFADVMVELIMPAIESSMRAHIERPHDAIAADHAPVERVYAHDLLKQGGAWLGAARNWLKWHKHNGSNVTWGSADELRPPFTARDVDEIAAEVAAAVLSDQGDERRHNDKLFKARLDAEFKLDSARKLAREILDRSENLDGNALDDGAAVALAKLVLGEE